MKKKFLGFYIDAIVANIFFFLPIYSILFYDSLGFSLTKIGILIGIIPLSGLVFEIPTGVFADKFGRKYSTILGYVIMGSAYLFVFFFQSYVFLIIANIAIGFGGTFITGAMNSWKSDLLPKRKLHSFFVTLSSLTSVGSLISGFLGVFIVSLFGLSSIWIAAAISFMLGALSLSFVPASNVKNTKPTTFKDHYVHLKKAMRVIKRDKRIFDVVIAFTFLGFAYAFLTNLAWIPYLQDVGMVEEHFGYIWSGMAAVGIVAPYFGKILARKKSDVFRMRLLLALWILAMFLLLLDASVLFVLFIFALTVLFDLARIPLEESYFQNLLPQKEKATIASVQALFFSVSLLLGYPLVGFIADTFSSLTVLIIGGVLLLPVMWFFRK